MSDVMPDADLATVDTANRPGADEERAVHRRSKGLLTIGLCALAVALVALVALSLAIGTKSIPLGDVIDAVFRFDPDISNHLIVHDQRIPRTVVGLLVGVGLGLAGVLMQGVTRNPLADPGLLGVEAGASFGVVISVYVFGAQTLSTYVWFAFAGAAMASVGVFALGSIGRVRSTPVKLALAGAAIAALLTSLTSGVLFLDRLAFEQTRFWLVGSLAGRDMEIVTQAAPFILVGAILALLLGRALDLLSLGEDLAQALGQRVVLTQAAIILSVTLMTGGAVAAAGPVGFIGFFVPHIARALTGPSNRWTLAYTLILAPLILLSADIIGRVIVRPAELEVGIVTAVVGAPVFIMLVRRRRLAEL